MKAISQSHKRLRQVIDLIAGQEEIDYTTVVQFIHERLVSEFGPATARDFIACTCGTKAMDSWIASALNFCFPDINPVWLWKGMGKMVYRLLAPQMLWGCWISEDRPDADPPFVGVKMILNFCTDGTAFVVEDGQYVKQGGFELVRHELLIRPMGAFLIGEITPDTLCLMAPTYPGRECDLYYFKRLK